MRRPTRELDEARRGLGELAARSAVGTNALPLNVAVEVEAVVEYE